MTSRTMAWIWLGVAVSTAVMVPLADGPPLLAAIAALIANGWEWCGRVVSELRKQQAFREERLTLVSRLHVTSLGRAVADEVARTLDGRASEAAPHESSGGEPGGGSP